MSFSRQRNEQCIPDLPLLSPKNTQTGGGKAMELILIFFCCLLFFTREQSVKISMHKIHRHNNIATFIMITYIDI